MNRIGHAIKSASFIGGYFAGLLILGIMALTIVEVTSRYLLKFPLRLSDELGGYTNLLISFLALAYCWAERGHIRLTVVVERLSTTVSNWLRVVTLILSLGYVLLASKVSIDFIITSFRRNIHSNTWLMLPVQWFQMAIPLGFILLALAIIVALFFAIINVRKGVRTEISTEDQTESGAL